MLDSQTIQQMLAEDIGSGDLTVETTLPETVDVRAEIVAKAPGVVAGLSLVAAVYAELSGSVLVELAADDGKSVLPGACLAELRGPAGPILTGERTLLNLLGRLCGIATLTRSYAAALSGTATQLLDTRKTTPGLRSLEKHAVAMGGGVNHRMGLHDAVLIKENHLRAACAKGNAQRFQAVVRRAVESGRGRYEVQVEVESLDELGWALSGGADAILLDNMDRATLTEAVRIAREHPTSVTLEASGGISLATIRSVARISVGALTHSAPCLDLSLLVRDVLD